MFSLYSISSCLGFRSVGHIFSIYENSKSKFLKNIKVFGEISNIWLNDILGKNVCSVGNYLGDDCC